MTIFKKYSQVLLCDIFDSSGSSWVLASTALNSDLIKQVDFYHQIRSQLIFSG